MAGIGGTADPSGAGDAVAAGFELAGEAVAVFDGPALVCRAATSALRRLVGRDLVGMTLREGLHGVAGEELLELHDRVLATGEPVDAHALRLRSEHPDRDAEHAPTEVLLDVALTPWFTDEGGVRGVVSRATDVTEREQRRAGERAGDEAERMRLVRSGAMVTGLQDALLPAQLPVAPGMEVGAAYLLADDGGTAGGDWFDAVVRADGRVVLVTGDVVGDGVEAAATMGRLRAVLHHRLRDGDEPLGTVLGHLDRFAHADGLARAATMCAVEVEPDTGEATYVTAGHPTPLVVRAGGATGYLDPSGHGPLGVAVPAQGRTPVPPARTTLARGDVLLLHTDGLLGRPGTAPGAATVALGRAAATAVRRSAPEDAAPVVDRVCTEVLERLARTGHPDDVALLAARRVDPPAALRVALPAVPVSAPRARLAVVEWLTALAVRDLDVIAAQHAVGELMANAVDHAYDATDDAERPDAVVLTAELAADGTMTCAVVDRGRWVPPAGGSPEAAVRGRGLALVAGFTSSLEVVPNAWGGTTAAFTMLLGRPAAVLTGGGPGMAAQAQEESFRAEVQDHPWKDGWTVQVGGALDSEAADELALVLDRATYGGARGGGAVDLAAVSHLGSRAVQVLHEHPSLNLLAPFGSVAQQVCEVVGLPYEDPAGNAWRD